MLTPRGQIQRVSVLPARASSCQSTSTAAYNSSHTFHPARRAYCITPKGQQGAIHLKGKSCLNSIASSRCHPLKMANINTVDINHLKKGEVNLGVSSCAPRTPHRHFCNTFSYRSCSSQLTPSSQTSIMAVQFNGGVVIGADTRTTTGSYIVSSALTMTRLKGQRDRADVCFLRYSLS